MRLAIVIPALNEAKALPPLLAQLQVWRDTGDEVIVVDGGSDDATRELAGPWVDQLLNSERGRARQLNAGAAAASDSVQAFWFLHADSDVACVRRDEIVAALLSTTPWGWCTVAIDDQAPVFRLVERCMRWRSSATRVCTGDQAMFVDRRLFERLGQYRDIALMEDVEFAKRARQICTPHVVRGTVRTSSRRWRGRGIVKTVLLMWRLRLLWWLGISPARLARAYDHR